MSVSFSFRGVLDRENGCVLVRELEVDGSAPHRDTMTMDAIFGPHVGRYVTVSVESSHINKDGNVG